MKAYLKNLYMFVVLSIITLPCFGQSFIHSQDDTDSIYTDIMMETNGFIDYGITR